MRDRRIRGVVRRPWYDSPWRIAGRVISSTLTVVVLGLVVALVVVPRLTGGASLTVLTGSMEPTFRPGDLVVVRGVSEDEVCAQVPVGTVVTFQAEPGDPALITHRVVGKTIGTFDDGTSCRLVTQGDNNSATDDPVSPAQVRGVFLYGLPKAGWVRQWVTEHVQIVGLLAAAAVAVYLLWPGSRRSTTRVLSVPPSGVPAAGLPAAPAAPVPDDRERGLRERELDLREREIALRERELVLRAGEPEPSTSVTSEA